MRSRSILQQAKLGKASGPWKMEIPVDNAAALKREIANNHINVFFTSVDDIISVWQIHQNIAKKDSKYIARLHCVSPRVDLERLKTCHPPTACRAGQPLSSRGTSSRNMSTAYHAHGRVKKISISDITGLYEYLLDHRDKITFSKHNVAPYVSPVLDGLVLARVTNDLGISGKVLPKVINGRQYIAFSGHPGLRKIFTGTIYNANNVKIVNMAIGKLGMAKSIVKGTVITLFLTIPITIAESLLQDPPNLYALFGSVSSEIIKIGIQALFMGIAGLVLSSLKVYALLSGGLVIIIGLGIGAVLNNIDERYRLTEKLIKVLERLAKEVKQNKQELEHALPHAAHQVKRNIIWRTLGVDVDNIFTY